jgi:hypothetical protein
LQQLEGNQFIKAAEKNVNNYIEAENHINTLNVFSFLFSWYCPFKNKSIFVLFGLFWYPFPFFCYEYLVVRIQTKKRKGIPKKEIRKTLYLFKKYI